MSHRYSPTMPVRPALPPTLICALVLWATCAGIYTVAQVWDIVVCEAVGAGCAVGVAFAVTLLWRTRKALLWCVVLGMAAGGLCGCAGAAGLHAAQETVTGQGSLRLRCEALEDGTRSARGSYGVVRTRLAGGIVIDMRVFLAPDAALLRYGDVFEADVSPTRPQGREESYCWQRGIAATAFAKETSFVERQDILGALLAVRDGALEVIGRVDGEGAVVLQALVCGWRADLGDTDLYEAFKATGLAHVVAVSGAHLVIVVGFCGIILKALRVPRGAATIVQIVLVLCYLVLSAAPISAVRAAIMTVAGMGSWFAHRRPASLNALGICILAMVVLSPSTALSVSFALSALSTLGIVLFAGLFSVWIGGLIPSLPKCITDALALTFAAGIAVQPIATSLFSQLPLISPLANVAAALLFPIACTVGLLAVLITFVIPPVGGVLLRVALAASDALCATVRVSSSFPYASIPLSLPFAVAVGFTIIVAAALWLCWPRPRLRTAGLLASAVFALLFGSLVVAPQTADNEIIMLDVGQGDAFVIRSHGKAVLIDTGNQDRMLREALARHGVYRLDAVIVTHADDDHCGSLSTLAHTVGIDRILLAQEALSCPCDACRGLRENAASLVGMDDVEGLVPGDLLRVGVFDLSVIWPHHFSAEGGNADSVCLLARADVDEDGATDWTTLFTGDAEKDELAAMVAMGAVGNVDMYKVGHHGSKRALTPELAQVLAPRIALVSVGEGNRYGHPADETLAMLEEVGTQVWRTDEEGDVSCKLHVDEIMVGTLR